MKALVPNKWRPVVVENYLPTLNAMARIRCNTILGRWLWEMFSLTPDVGMIAKGEESSRQKCQAEIRKRTPPRKCPSCGHQKLPGEVNLCPDCCVVSAPKKARRMRNAA